jgi:repressor LexA
MRPLTQRQRAVLDVIKRHISKCGVSPTLREIGAELDIRSTNAVNDHLNAIEDKGYIARPGKPGAWRSITVLRRAS